MCKSIDTIRKCIVKYILNIYHVLIVYRLCYIKYCEQRGTNELKCLFVFVMCTRRPLRAEVFKKWFIEWEVSAMIKFSLGLYYDKVSQSKIDYINSYLNICLHFYSSIHFSCVIDPLVPNQVVKEVKRLTIQIVVK